MALNFNIIWMSENIILRTSVLWNVLRLVSWPSMLSALINSLRAPENRSRQCHPTPVLLPGKSHGWRSLVGFSPWSRQSRTWLSDFTFTFHFHALEKEMATHTSVLTWRIPGTGEPGGLLSMGSHRIRHDWSDLAAAAAAAADTIRNAYMYLNI